MELELGLDISLNTSTPPKRRNTETLKRRKETIDFSPTKLQRRKFSTKNCAECQICSNDIFEICHPHLSTQDMLRNKGANGRNARPIWCQICQDKHPDPDLDRNSRKKVVMGSSTLAHLWKSKDYKNPPFHIDFDCIIGGQIHDVHESFEKQYFENPAPLDIILACGMNNVPTEDTAEQIILQFTSILGTICKHSVKHGHKVGNRVVICPLLFAPKFCDDRLEPNDNFLDKIIQVNKWIKSFNKEHTGLKIGLDKLGVEKVPKVGATNVMHDYGQWNEPQWTRMLHLNAEAKSIVAQQVFKVFTKLEKKLEKND